MQTHKGTDMDGHKSRCPHTHTRTDPHARTRADVCCTHCVRMSKQTSLQTQMRAGEDANTSGGVYLQKQKGEKKE